MTPGKKRQTELVVAAASLAVLLLLLAFWAFSRPHSPLQYMVGGTLATSILLAGAFLQILKRGYLGRRRRTDKGH